MRHFSQLSATRFKQDGENARTGCGGSDEFATLKIGVLALQGDFAEHKAMLDRLGCQSVYVKHGFDLPGLDGLIIPGGESTTIAKLTEDDPAATSIFQQIRQRAQAGMPLYGTCMGTIFLSREIESSSQGRLALMDIRVLRNAFGPQLFSRQQTIDIKALGEEPFPAVFIRAPIITACGDAVQVLAKVDEGIVMARQNNLLASAFHPELTEDDRVHRYFLRMVADHKRAMSAVAGAGQPAARLNSAPALARA